MSLTPTDAAPPRRAAVPVDVVVRILGGERVSALAVRLANGHMRAVSRTVLLVLRVSSVRQVLHAIVPRLSVPVPDLQRRWAEKSQRDKAVNLVSPVLPVSVQTDVPVSLRVGALCENRDRPHEPAAPVRSETRFRPYLSLFRHFVIGISRYLYPTNHVPMVSGVVYV